MVILNIEFLNFLTFSWSKLNILTVIWKKKYSGTPHHKVKYQALSLINKFSKPIFLQSPVQIKRHSRWQETKDAVVAVVCGCVAVAVGVVGVIVMTRQLVEEDEPFPMRSCYPPSSSNSRQKTLPTISENDDECEVANQITDRKHVLTNKNDYSMKLPTIDEAEWPNYFTFIARGFLLVAIAQYVCALWQNKYFGKTRFLTVYFMTDIALYSSIKFS